MPLIENIHKLLAKGFLVQLRLSTAVLATDAAIQNNIFGSSTTALVLSNEDLNDIVAIVKFLEERSLFIKGVSEIIKNEAKEQKGQFLGILLVTLSASLLGNMLAGKGVVRGGEEKIQAGKGMIRAGKGTVRA